MIALRLRESVVRLSSTRSFVAYYNAEMRANDGDLV